MIGLYREIRGDLFNIVRRLKAFDKDYFVVYSYRDNRYEVHNKGNKGNTFCFACPSLDERTIIKALKTRRERIEDLLRETELDNERRLKEEMRKTAKKIEFGSENVLSKGGIM